MAALKALHIEFDVEEFEELQALRREDKSGKRETWREALLRLARGEAKRTKV